MHQLIGERQSLVNLKLYQWLEDQVIGKYAFPRRFWWLSLSAAKMHALQSISYDLFFILLQKIQ